MTRSRLVVVAASLALAACGGSDRSGGSEKPVAETQEATTAAPAVTGPTTKTQREDLEREDESRQPAPAIAGTTLDGERVALADLSGRPVFVKVFGGY